MTTHLKYKSAERQSEKNQHGVLVKPQATPS